MTDEIGLNRLLARNRSTTQMGDDGARLLLSDLPPSARSALTKLSRGEGLTSAESETLRDALRRQAGRTTSLSESQEMWARSAQRAGIPLKPEVAAALAADDDDAEPDTTPGREMWRKVAARRGWLKPDGGES